MAWLVNICCCISMRSCGVHCNGKLLFWLRFFHIRLRFCIYWSTFLCRLTWLFPDVRVIFSCIELVSVSELHFWLLADSLMWSLSSGQDIFSMCNMAGSEDLHLHSVSSVVLVALGHRNFQPLLSKNFKAVLFPSWYFSVIVLLCLLPSRHAARILQIHLYSLPFIIWNVGRLLMPYLWIVLSLCYCSRNRTKGAGFVQLMAIAVYGTDSFIWNYISFAGQHNCAVSPELYILRNFRWSDGSVRWHRTLFQFMSW